MTGEIALSQASLTLAGILLLAIVTIETGGLFLVTVARGRQPLNEFQKSFARAGHGHAGALVILALLCQIFADATDQTGVWSWLSRSGVAIAAILMPAGFFFSSMGRGREQPNGLIALVYIGATMLALGVISLGVGLLAAA
ncbi:MAG: hypothetical protein GEU93_02280 [Propionibacteriales bacterium]|nr:hypothetical protein [Propionibacteriales bacterium]